MHTVHTNTIRDLLHGITAPRHTYNSTKRGDLTLTYAITTEEFLEASPKGSGLEHFRALDEHRMKRTLGKKGLASRPLRLENFRPLLGKNTKTM